MKSTREDEYFDFVTEQMAKYGEENFEVNRPRKDFLGLSYKGFSIFRLNATDYYPRIAIQLEVPSRIINDEVQLKKLREELFPDQNELYRRYYFAWIESKKELEAYLWMLEERINEIDEHNNREISFRLEDDVQNIADYIVDKYMRLGLTDKKKYRFSGGDGHAYIHYIYSEDREYYGQGTFNLVYFKKYKRKPNRLYLTEEKGKKVLAKKCDLKHDASANCDYVEFQSKKELDLYDSYFRSVYKSHMSIINKRDKEIEESKAAKESFNQAMKRYTAIKLGELGIDIDPDTIPDNMFTADFNGLHVNEELLIEYLISIDVLDSEGNSKNKKAARLLKEKLKEEL